MIKETEMSKVFGIYLKYFFDIVYMYRNTMKLREISNSVER
jgi:hypothetical protein